MIQGDIEKGVGGGGGGLILILPWYPTDLSMVLTKGEIKY